MSATAPAPLPIEVQPWLARDLADGGLPGYVHKQWVYRFANGYGASVVQGTHTYGGSGGLYELGVIVFDGDDWRLTYDTPVTSDVLGHLSLTEVAGTLARIAALPAGGAS